MTLLALVLSLWVAANTKQHLELRVTVPADADELEVAVGCDHEEWHSARALEPSSPPQRLTFTRLHGDLYTIRVAVRHADGHITLVTRDVVVTD